MPTVPHPPPSSAEPQLLSALLRPFEDEEVERQQREQAKEKLRVAAEADLVQRRLAGLGQGPEGGASGSGGEGATAGGRGAAGAAAMQTDQAAAAAGGEAAADAAAAAVAAGGGSAEVREASPGGSGTQQAVAPSAPSPAPAGTAAAAAEAAGAGAAPGAAGEAAGGSGAGAPSAAEETKPADEEKQREEDRRHAEYKAAFEALPLGLLRTLPQVRGLGSLVGSWFAFALPIRQQRTRQPACALPAARHVSESASDILMLLGCTPLHVAPASPPAQLLAEDWLTDRPASLLKMVVQVGVD